MYVYEIRFDLRNLSQQERDHWKSRRNTAESPIGELSNFLLHDFQETGSQPDAMGYILGL
jgi:hypothetical protein